MTFQQNVVGGTALLRDAINSPNFITGQQGWSINRDGSAEFNSVVVRGTVIASDFRSANYVPGVQGFDINGSTGIAEFNTTLRVGGANPAPNITLAMVGTQPEVILNTGAAAQVYGGTLFGAVNGSTPVALLSSPQTANGAVEMQLSPGLVAGNPAAVSMLTLGVTGDANGIKQTFNLGGAATDKAVMTINNSNSVISGGGLGEPAMIIGDHQTPLSRMYHSSDELLAITAAGGIGTLFLNSDRAKTFTGFLASPQMSTGASIDAAGGATSATGFTGIGTTGFNFTVPPSGAMLISISARMTLTGTAAAGNRGLMTFVLTGGGGHAANDNEAIELAQQVAGVTTIGSLGRTLLVSGLTPGAACILTINGRVTNALMVNTMTNIRVTLTPQF